MLDAYSFDVDEESMAKSYENVRKAFLEIFEKIGMKVIPIVADNGAMGGKKSEEFMLISEQGEDKILYDDKNFIIKKITITTIYQQKIFSIAFIPLLMSMTHFLTILYLS